MPESCAGNPADAPNSAGSKRKRARRGRGEGSITTRERNGKVEWVAKLSLGYDGNGKRVRKAVYSATKKDVQDKLTELRGRVHAGNIPAANNMTVADLLRAWLKATQSQLGVRTHEERERTVINHLLPRLGVVKLFKLTSLHVESLYGDMHAEKIGVSAIRASADVLSIALNYAVRLKLIAANPATAVKKPKLPKSEKHFLTDTHVKALLATAAALPAAGISASTTLPLLATAIGTGCRQGELLALSWDDVDFKAASLNISKSLSYPKAGPLVKEPKNASSRRTVKLPKFVVTALTAHKAAAFKAGLLAAPVFCTRASTHLDKSFVVKQFRAVV